WLMMSLWDALRMNMMISYQELVRTFLNQITRFYKISRKLQHLLRAIIACEVITLSSNIQT
ncbi:hypothetical protein ACOS7U_22390, partial [Escherichia coli]|uniref:hypothetical protein n=1 Tax=Escherichia coli TaxID=562 RepID=UPI003B9C26E0